MANEDHETYLVVDSSLRQVMAVFSDKDEAEKYVQRHKLHAVDYVIEDWWTYGTDEEAKDDEAG